MYVTARTNADIIRIALSGQSGCTRNNNFSTAHYQEGYMSYCGQLPSGWATILDAAFREGRISQVIYSYSTPIAWHDSRYGWIIPVVSYSITTSSKHQTHLYRLRGQHIAVPYDASAAEIQRVLDGLMSFTTNASGKFTGTIAGTNYTPGE